MHHLHAPALVNNPQSVIHSQQAILETEKGRQRTSVVRYKLKSVNRKADNNMDNS